MMNKKIKKGSKFIPVFEPYISFRDKFEVLKAINNKNISGSSELIDEFESGLCETFNVKHAITVSNGSVALDLALQLLNLNEEDEVILPSFTIISCLAAVVRAGGTPKFCDVDKDSWNMTLDNVKSVVSTKTKAILMVHTYGLTAEADKIKEFANSEGIILVEDVAEAHGQSLNKKLCGTFGDLATLSFYANKHITTGEGGAVLTNSTEFANVAKKMKNLDFDPKRRFQHDNLYWNYRMGSLQAALGISQTKSLRKTISKKIKQGEIYNKLLSENSNIQLPLNEWLGSKNHYWVYGIVVKNRSRDKLQTFLLDRNIQTRRFFWPLHLQKALPDKFRNSSNTLPQSEMLGSSGLYLPMGSHINFSDQKYIAESVYNFLDTEVSE